MQEEFFIRELSNGMTLLGQEMRQVSSAAMTLLVPAGAAHDPDDSAGVASVLCEWCLRGAADRNTRQLHDALDSLGCHHHESVQSEHIQFTTAQLGRNLPEVLAIFADILRRPRLDETTFAPSRALVVQDLAALEDEPAQKCQLLLREKFYPQPLGRCVYGTSDSLQAMTAETVRQHWQGHFSPQGAILSAAGHIDWSAFCDLAEKSFTDWNSPAPAACEYHEAEGGFTYIEKPTAQVQIALAHRSVPICHSRYYAARMAEMVLSGGMSSRLFMEVREKRGLAYYVATHYHSLKSHAGMFTLAGTTPERAQETLDTTVTELRRLARGIEADEMARTRTQLKTAIVMQGESTSARAAAMASDFYHLRRLRSLDELSQAIENVTTDEVLAYLDEMPAEGFTALLIGPEPLDMSEINK